MQAISQIRHQCLMALSAACPIACAACPTVVAQRDDFLVGTKPIEPFFGLGLPAPLAHGFPTTFIPVCR